MEAMRHALIQYEDGLRLNLHVPLTASLKWSKAQAAVTVRFDPSQPEYAVQFGEGTDGRFAVRLRRAPWAKHLRVEAAGKRVEEAPGEDIVIVGNWRSGDRIVCRYQPAVIIHADSTPPVRRSAIQRGLLVLAAIDATAKANGGVDVSCEETDRSKRIEVNLAGRFVGLKGLFWIPPDMVDWEHPERGITFVFSADGETLMMSRTDPVQGFMATQVMGADVRGKQKLVIDVTSLHEDFPIEAAHFTSLRLIAPDGNIVVLDDYLDGGRAPIRDLHIPSKVLADVLSMDIRQWPTRIRTAAGHLSLLPMKDLPNLIRPEGGIGHSAPIANYDFSVLVPFQGE